MSKVVSIRTDINSEKRQREEQAAIRDMDSCKCLSFKSSQSLNSQDSVITPYHRKIIKLETKEILDIVGENLIAQVNEMKKITYETYFQNLIRAQQEN